MPKLLTVVAPLTFLATIAGCETGPGPAKEPPVLKVTSPTRSFITKAGQLLVTGTVSPNGQGDAVDKVLVNKVQATLEAGGAFRALIDVPTGATLIETSARDVSGNVATDTRAVQAGPMRAVGSSVASAVTAALSADTFTKISAAAGPILKSLDMKSMLAPLQPMVHVDDPDGEDCAFARVFVDDLKFSDAKLSITPVQDGLAFTAEIDQLDVPAHARYAVLCVHGSNTLRVTADHIAIAGTLDVTPNGMAGFNTRLVNPKVTVTGFHLSASGIPGDILGLLHLDSAIQLIVAKGAELAMNPLMNMALGALGGPQQLDVLGQQLTMQVAPAAIAFDPDGAVLSMSMSALLAGSEGSPGYIYTDNGSPAVDLSLGPTHGFQLGIADDLVNELLAEVQAMGALDLTMAKPTQAFDAAQIHLTLPPMISADATDGAMRLVLGDLVATFTSHGTPVARAAINAKVDLKIGSTPNGGGVVLQLGTPTIHVDTLDDIANATGVSDDDLAKAVTASLAAELASVTQLFSVIPLPAIAGLQVRDVSISSDDGYVMLRGTF
ncbi:MAG TPA: hypothetical protein VLM79_27315 [Kofleriaceae bacterium]|nr:hypothetical protein [Kofleriaceae bacterium]